MSQPALVVFHRADFDGVCSAAIVKRFVPDCELYGIDYGDPFPWDKVEPLEANGMKSLRRVFMVDFSLKPDEMKRLSACCALVWCDHHKSALESCFGLDIRGVRSTALAGCELTWEWFASRDGEGMMPVPEAVRLLGRYDVWDAQNPDWPRIEAFQFGMRTAPELMDPADHFWEDVLDSGDNVQRAAEGLLYLGHFVSMGHTILRYRDQEAKALCADGAHLEFLFPHGACPKKNETETGFDAWNLICLNTLQRGSWQFNSVWDPEKHDAMCVYGQLKDGRWRVSLYSTKEEVDCGAICKALGGGGHKGAAGFICDRLPWEK